jgi:hypothetical protein
MTRRKREIVGLTNERDFPHLVELALAPGGFRRAARPSNCIFDSVSRSPEHPAHHVVAAPSDC